MDHWAHLIQSLQAGLLSISALKPWYESAMELAQTGRSLITVYGYGGSAWPLCVFVPPPGPCFVNIS